MLMYIVTVMNNDEIWRYEYHYKSTTTPVRPVFDASFKHGRNTSFNECLCNGPNLIELIPTMWFLWWENQSCDKALRIGCQKLLFLFFQWSLPMFWPIILHGIINFSLFLVVSIHWLIGLLKLPGTSRYLMPGVGCGHFRFYHNSGFYA